MWCVAQCPGRSLSQPVNWARGRVFPAPRSRDGSTLNSSNSSAQNTRLSPSAASGWPLGVATNGCCVWTSSKTTAWCRQAWSVQLFAVTPPSQTSAPSQSIDAPTRSISPGAWPRTTPPILSRGALEATGLDQAARFIEDTYTLSAVTSSESNPTTRGQPPLGREGEEAALRREAPLGMKGGLQESVLIGVTEGQREGGVGNKPGGSVEPVTQSGGVEGGEGRGYPKVVSVGSMSAARDPVKGDLKDLLTRMSDSRVIALTQKLSAARRDGDETEIRLLTEQLERALEGAGT
ncbi:uncharacterized protein LOC121325457 isoform X4 [Polyodon spathula]|uniref:uncharacterized protein LOC121325457 isoform X4 n=1 Tax=Polyodon spathula TaxID=7913 RepID=UPI001B7EA5E7|nr:uncharacterized protein LOC121325457 isoform X4 [Polyodon spathula]